MKLNVNVHAASVCVQVFEASAMATVFSDMCLTVRPNEMLMLTRSESQQISRWAETFPWSLQTQADAALSFRVQFAQARYAFAPIAPRLQERRQQNILHQLLTEKEN